MALLHTYSWIQKFTYTKLTAFKQLENVMALEASNRLIDIISVNWRCTCGFISRPTFKLSAFPMTWENQKKSAKTHFFVDLHKSGSSLEAISKCLKVSPSSVQTIVHKYKHHGTTQPSHRSGSVLSPRDERTLVRKVQINPRTAAKGPCEDAGGKVQKHLYPQ